MLGHLFLKLNLKMEARSKLMKQYQICINHSIYFQLHILQKHISQFRLRPSYEKIQEEEMIPIIFQHNSIFHYVCQNSIDHSLVIHSQPFLVFLQKYKFYEQLLLGHELIQEVVHLLKDVLLSMYHYLMNQKRSNILLNQQELWVNFLHQ